MAGKRACLEFGGDMRMWEFEDTKRELSTPSTDLEM
jgi:hypothetical protein